MRRITDQCHLGNRHGSPGQPHFVFTFLMQSSEPPGMAHFSNPRVQPEDPSLVQVAGLTIRTTNYTRKELRDYINWQASNNDEKIKRALDTIENARWKNEEFRYFLDRMDNNELLLKKPIRFKLSGACGGRRYSGQQSAFNQYGESETSSSNDTSPPIDTSVPPPNIFVMSGSEKLIATRPGIPSEIVGEIEQQELEDSFHPPKPTITPGISNVVSEPEHTESENSVCPITSEILPVVSPIVNEPEQLEPTNPVFPIVVPIISNSVNKPKSLELDKAIFPATPTIMADISHVVREPEQLEQNHLVQPITSGILPVVSQVVSEQKQSKPSLPITSEMSLDLSSVVESIPSSSNTPVETQSTQSEPKENEISQRKESQTYGNHQERLHKTKPLTLADYLSVDLQSSINSASTSRGSQKHGVDTIENPVPKTKIDTTSKHVPNGSVGMNTFNRECSYVPRIGRSFADVVKQSKGGSSSNQSFTIKVSETSGSSETPDDVTEQKDMVGEVLKTETSLPESFLTSQPEVESSDLQAANEECELFEKLGPALEGSEVVKKVTPLQRKTPKPRKEAKKKKQAFDNLGDELGITEIEKKEKKAKLIMKVRYEFYLKDQPRIRNKELALDSLPEICSAIYDRILCSKAAYSSEKYSSGVVQSFIEENRKRQDMKKKKQSSPVSDDKVVRSHILPLFFTVISEMRNVNAHRKWINDDVRHMMKHQEIYVYYRAATNYIGHVSWDRIETYMKRQCHARETGSDPDGVSAIERELMVAARKNTVNHLIYTDSDFFMEQRAHHKQNFESSPPSALLHLYYVILGTGWQKSVDNFDSLVHVLNFDFFYFSQLSRLVGTNIVKRESDYFHMFFWV